MAYENMADYEAAKRLILDQFIENAAKHPTEVEVFVNSLLSATSNQINSLVMMAMVNALCKDRL